LNRELSGSNTGPISPVDACGCRWNNKTVMPRDGAITFSDIEAKLSVLKVACSKCTRRGHYIVPRLIRAHGRNAKIIDWLDVITGRLS
jgi:hypothetical protein